MQNPEFVSGSVPLSVGGETFKTCYRVFGDLKARRPLVCLHGGPGFPSNYLEPFAQLAERGIPVILYDQFGCGESQPLDPDDVERLAKVNPDNKIWTFKLFMDELDNILNHFGIADDFDLLGQSWGGILAIQYTIDRQPKGLRSLILANSPPSVPDWIKSSHQIIEPGVFGFPRNHRNVIKFAEKHDDLEEKLTKEELEELRSKKITLDSPEYQAALGEFMHYFDLRLQPWPDSWNKALALAGRSVVNKIMWGPAWTNPSGILAKWSAKDSLHKIQARTLVYHGAYEQAQDFVVAPFLKLIPKCELVKFEHSSHLPQYEETERCMEVVAKFLLAGN